MNVPALPVAFLPHGQLELGVLPGVPQHGFYTLVSVCLGKGSVCPGTSFYP